MKRFIFGILFFVTIVAQSQTINGNVFNDLNALTDNTVNGTGVSSLLGVQLRIHLVNTLNIVVNTTNVGVGGTFSFTGVANGAYTLQLSTSTGTIGSPPPAVALTSTYVNTGEFIGAGVGNDGIANGILAVTMAGSTINNANFGVNRLPTSITATNPDVGENVNRARLNGLTATDFDGGSINLYQILSLPLATEGILFLNSTPVTVGQTLTTTQATQLFFTPTSGFSGTSSFTFRARDNGNMYSSDTGVIYIPVFLAPVKTDFEGSATLRDSMQALCWSFPDMLINRGGTAPMRGAGSMVTGNSSSPTQSTGWWTPYLDISGTLKVAFLWRKTATGFPRWIKIILIDQLESRILIDSLNITANPSGTDFYYSKNFAVTGTYRVYMNFQGNGGSFRLAVDDISINGTYHYPNPPTTCNRIPTAFPDSNMTAMNKAVSANLRINDIDPENEGISTFIQRNPRNGTVTLDSNGNYTYTPTGGFIGVDTFYYRICDRGYPKLCRTDSTPVIIQVVNLLGRIWNDSNGTNDGQINGTPISTVSGQQLYINLIDTTSGLVIKTIQVAPDGTYGFAIFSPTTFKVQLSINQGTVGSLAPLTALPDGWRNTADGFGMGDGNPNGEDVISVVPTDTSVAHFGLNRRPETHEKVFTNVSPTAFSTPSGNILYPYKIPLNNPAGTTNDNTNFSDGTLPGRVSASDAEDGLIEGLSGESNHTLVIDSLATGHNILVYKGKLLKPSPTISDPSYIYWSVANNRYEIPLFKPDSLEVYFTSGLGPNTGFTFYYSFMDQQGFKSLPKKYQMVASAPLPVTLVRFAAKLEGPVVVLNWSTAKEINNHYFEIQHSTNGTFFSSIGTLEGKGNSDEWTNYTFEHISAEVGNNYYRLKQIDFDGGFTYSNKVLVKVITKTPYNQLNIYPNPVAAGQKIHFKLPENLLIEQGATIEINTLQGLNIAKESLKITEKTAMDYMMPNHLQTGLYLLKITTLKTNFSSIVVLIE